MREAPNPPLSDPRERLGLALGDCARTWRQRINARLKPLGLSQSAWMALWQLAQHPDGLVQAELADRLGIEGPTLVRLLDRLQQDGLVERLAAPDDRRCKRVQLTPAAQPVLQQVRQSIADLRAEVLADLPDSDISQGLQLLEHLRQRLEQAQP
ncbi:MAG: hypothetical protein RIR00_934 [Pseudomonadota bacterium]